jgi:hypothetical protein
MMEVPLRGNRRLASLNAEHFDEVNGAEPLLHTPQYFYAKKIILSA